MLGSIWWRNGWFIGMSHLNIAKAIIKGLVTTKTHTMPNDLHLAVCYSQSAGNLNVNRKNHIGVDFLAIDCAGSEVWKQSNNTQHLTIEC